MVAGDETFKKEVYNMNLEIKHLRKEV